MHKVSIFFYILTNTWLLHFVLATAISVGVQWYLIVILIYISLTIIVSTFFVLISHFYKFFDKMTIQILYILIAFLSLIIKL